MPVDRVLALVTIQEPSNGFLVTGDVNSQSQRRGDNTVDKGKEVEAGQDEHAIRVNDPHQEERQQLSV